MHRVFWLFDILWHFGKRNGFSGSEVLPFRSFSLDRYFTACSLFSLVRSDREPDRGYSCSSREGYNVRNWKIMAELANLSPRNVTRTVIIRSRIFLCFRLAQILLLIFHIQPALAYYFWQTLAILVAMTSVAEKGTANQAHLVCLNWLHCICFSDRRHPLCLKWCNVILFYTQESKSEKK